MDAFFFNMIKTFFSQTKFREVGRMAYTQIFRTLEAEAGLGGFEANLDYKTTTKRLIWNVTGFLLLLCFCKQMYKLECLQMSKFHCIIVMFLIESGS